MTENSKLALVAAFTLGTLYAAINTAAMIEAWWTGL